MAAALALTACNQGNDEGGKFDIRISGEEEVCQNPNACGGPGTGVATIEVNSDRNEVCYDISLTDLEEVTGAHIHQGQEGQAGGIVVDLQYEGDDSGGEGCVDGIDEGALERVSENPNQHYLNVHTKQYPDGAARGQLEG